MKRLAVAALSTVLLSLGCGGGPPQPAVEVERVVALAPSLVELVYAVGAGDLLVGVGDFARHPPEVLELPRLGGLVDPHLEEIVSLDPDLAILLPSEERVARHLEALDIEVMVVPSETIDDVLAAAVAVGTRLGRAARGGELASEWRRQLEPRPLAGGRTVLLAVGRPVGEMASILAAGDATFLGQLVSRLGARNAVADTGLAYPQVGLEAVLDRQPDLIVELHGEPLGAERRTAAVADWNAFPQLPAVRHGCVAVVAGDHVLLPGPRLPQLYRELGRALADCESEAS